MTALTVAKRDRVVYETRRALPAGRPLHPRVMGLDGKWHAYLNAGRPERATAEDAATSVCCRCGHGYAHLINARRILCDECRLDDAAEHALQVQDDYGVDLGWQCADRADMAYQFIRAGGVIHWPTRD